jgi:hypothetical protein
MKKILKIFILSILHFIRAILTYMDIFIGKTKYVLRRHVLPQKRNASSPPSTHGNLFPYYDYDSEQRKSSYEHFKKYFKTSIFLETWELRTYSIKKAIENDLEQKKYYLEFGVFTGNSTNFLATELNTKIYGFDSFTGFKEDWQGSYWSKGGLDLKGKIPDLNKNVIPVKGWVQDTLPKFLNEKKPSINFVHMDMDTYETSKFVLSNIKPFLNKSCIITFDDFYNFSGWDVGEYKAFIETFNDDEYKFLAFSKFGRQATIQILR